jgi:hypothetical protein
MHNRSRWWLAGVLLWPLVSHAVDFDVPELGVRLTALPAEAVPPQLSAVPGGYAATTKAGVAELSIYREDAPAPPGSDVADPHYRETLDRQFRDDLESKSEGAPTQLASHSAWTVVDAHRLGSGSTLYTCLTYVIVDEHLYRLIVSAHSALGRPPEFDSLVVAMSGVKFEPVRRAAAPAAARAG